MRLLAIDELEARVEKLIAGGDGLVRFEGIPIFVPRSAPGDLLRVRLVERRPSFGRGEIIEILEPGEGRRTPPCPHFERCGGCDLQHLENKLQLRLKAETVRENLLRLGGIEMPSDVTVIPGDPWAYRLRAQLHVATTERGVEVGYFARRSHDLVPVDTCPVLVPELERELPGLGRRLGETTHRRLDMAAGDEGSWTCQPRAADLPGGAVSMRIDKLVFQYDAGCFFQNHRQLLPRLIEHALAPPAGAGDESDAVAYDLFAGVGLFSLPLCRRFQQVVAVEGERTAARFARKNARLNGISNLTVETQAIESWIENLPADAALVVADPPRVGLSPTVRATLLERRPRRLTYVSCDSATLARDLKDLKAEFRIVSLVLLDMFPQTGHMEVVVQLEAREAARTSPEDAE
ncbi:MAG: class I SAM-dependent RNA methyltransferase [Thermoanaerobaculia bacterium]